MRSAAAVALVLVGLGLVAAAPAAAGPPRVAVGWPAEAGAAVRPGQVLEIRVRVAGGPRRRTPLADVALLSVTRSGAPRAVLARRRARSRTVRVRVPAAAAAGSVRLRVRAAERIRSRSFRVAPASRPGAPGRAPGVRPVAPGPACDAPAGSALATAGAPAAAPAGGTVGLLVTNTGPTCLTGGTCPALEVQAADGSWTEAVDEERACPAIAVVLEPRASRRFDYVLPADLPPGSAYRLVLSLAGPEATLEATTPVEVLPAG